jgi:hypothetical protein
MSYLKKYFANRPSQQYIKERFLVKIKDTYLRTYVNTKLESTFTVTKQITKKLFSTIKQKTKYIFKNEI